MKPIEKIINLGATFYSVSKENLVSRRRDDPLVRIRFSVMGACREEGYTLNQIGIALNRDHGTVIHGLKQLNESSMAEMWRNHIHFLETLKSRTDLDDQPIKDVLVATKVAISDIDDRITRLNELRRTLAESLVKFEQNMDVIQSL